MSNLSTNFKERHIIKRSLTKIGVIFKQFLAAAESNVSNSVKKL